MASKLSLLTSADAVREAIAECDRLGRDAFLRKYGYRHSREYPLRFASGTYDSKAIVGVAFGKQHGTPLKFSEFSGGIATVIPVLKRLGFVAREALHPIEFLIPGKTYARKELLELYGGQLQSGIWTPREFPVVFLFTGESGLSYEDGWTSTGVFRYTGEGQTGDMKFTGGNKAIRDHRQSGRDLFLFDDLGKGSGVRFVGLFECASWEERDGKDKQSSARKIIVFDLVPVGTAASSDDEHDTDTSELKARSLKELRTAAYAAASPTKPNAKAGDAKRVWYERSGTVRAYVLARANGTCEACDAQAPFKKRDGTPYLEPHHTTRLADDGPDHPASVGAICPTCHRRIHSGDDGTIWNKQLQRKLKQKEDGNL